MVRHQKAIICEKSFLHFQTGASQSLNHRPHICKIKIILVLIAASMEDVKDSIRYAGKDMKSLNTRHSLAILRKVSSTSQKQDMEGMIKFLP